MWWEVKVWFSFSCPRVMPVSESLAIPVERPHCPALFLDAKKGLDDGGREGGGPHKEACGGDTILTVWRGGGVWASINAKTLLERQAWSIIWRWYDKEGRGQSILAKNSSEHMPQSRFTKK